ncbi:acyltransferase family protein [Dermatobacter hominis]|uniref:acyltransferase family protein n=1 Tax=Dermatobacter hominis TaxID=2884263 RepID=UPI001D123EA7|nr:acyltransferase [Dermatobacter hominis]UDY36461.1 acyltransferase [Dermatobacter hominis]
MKDGRGRIAPPEGARFHWEDLPEAPVDADPDDTPATTVEVGAGDVVDRDDDGEAGAGGGDLDDGDGDDGGGRRTGGAATTVLEREPRAVRRVERRRSTATTVEPLGHRPALDGLRAVAVAAVLVYHARFEWIPGGFLGVSAFFTLSGFLITSLLLREHAGSGGVDLRRFWRRRFRRLLPASWTTIALVLAMGAIGLWTTDQLRDLRSDVPFSLAEIVNWHFIAADRSYGAQFVAPSPLEHFWSLSVEQQFYVLLPLLLLGGLALGRRRAERSLAPLVGVLAVVGLASAVANGVFARSSIDRAYFGTDTRMVEMVVGALLACAMLHGIRLRPGPLRRIWPALSVVAVVVTLWLWHVATVESTWMYPWGFLLTAAATATIIVGALQPGVLGSVMSWRPLVWIGGISYGIYLLHWPVFLWLTPARTGWAPWPLFALRVAVTITAAFVMHRVVEQPIRLGDVLPSPRGAALAGVALIALIGGDAVVTNDLPAPSALEQASASQPTAPPAPPLVKVLVVGDELAGTLQPVAGEEVDGLEVSVAAAPSCGLTVGGYVQVADGRIERDPDRCGAVRDTWTAAVEQQRPDIVLVWGGVRDLANRRLGVEDQSWLPSNDPAIADFQRADVGALLDGLSSTGSRVVVLTVPRLESQVLPGPTPPVVVSSDPQRAALSTYRDEVAASGAPAPSHTENDPARIDAWNQLLTAVAADRGADVLDLAGELRTRTGGELAPQLRDVGLGLTAEGRSLVLEWLEPQLREITERTAPASTPSVASEAPLPPAPPPAPRRTAAPGRRATVMVAGDSVAYNYSTALAGWAQGRSDVRTSNVAQLGCPIARGGDFRFLRNFNEFPGRCDWSATFPGWLAERDPNVVVLTSGIWEVVDRKLPGDSRWRHIGQPEIDDYLLRELLSAIDVLGSKGATVALVTYPHFDAGQDQGFTGLPESEPARVDRLNEIIRHAASLRPGVTAVIDLQTWLASQPGGEVDPAKRQDGLHFLDSYLPTIGEWMGPQVLELARNGPPPAPAGG